MFILLILITKSLDNVWILLRENNIDLGHYWDLKGYRLFGGSHHYFKKIIGKYSILDLPWFYRIHVKSCLRQFFLCLGNIWYIILCSKKKISFWIDIYMYMQLVRLICRKPVTLQVNNKLHNICTININYTVNAKVLINIHIFSS